MELKQYLKIIKKHLKLIELMGLLVAGSAFLFTIFQPVHWDVSLGLLVSRAGSQQTSDYKYDGYYLMKASDEFGDVVVQWLKDPRVVTDIFEKGGVKFKRESLRKIKRIFDADKMSSHYVEVRFKAKSEEEARKLVTAVAQVLQERAGILRSTTWREVAFSVTGSEPVIIKHEPEVVLNTIVGLISGLVIGILLGFGREYFT